MHYRNITCIFEKPAIFPCQLNDSCGSCAFRAANNYTNQRGENNRRTLASPFINISQSVNSLPRLYVSRVLCLRRLYISVTPFPCRVLACHAESSSCRLSRVKKKRKGKDVKKRVHVILVRFIHNPTGRQVVPWLSSIFPRLYVKKIILCVPSGLLSYFALANFSRLIRPTCHLISSSCFRRDLLQSIKSSFFFFVNFFRSINFLG